MVLRYIHDRKRSSTGKAVGLVFHLLSQAVRELRITGRWVSWAKTLHLRYGCIGFPIGLFLH
jgi:hypothetical protein